MLICYLYASLAINNSAGDDQICRARERATEPGAWRFGSFVGGGKHWVGVLGDARMLDNKDGTCGADAMSL